MRDKGYGYGYISRTLGININTVRSFSQKNNLGGVRSANSRVNDAEPVYCAYCGVLLLQTPHHRAKKFCNTQCRMRWWNKNKDKIKKKESSIHHYVCLCCGKEFSLYGETVRKYCSHSCYISHRFYTNSRGENLSNSFHV